MHLSESHMYEPIIRQVAFNRWETARIIDIPTPLGTVRIFRCFRFNRDSIVKNSPDFIPSLAHDFLCRHQIFADGSPCNRGEADRIYKYLNEQSHEWFNRVTAWHRYYGLRLLGWTCYPREPLPIPPFAAADYPHLSRPAGLNQSPAK